MLQLVQVGQQNGSRSLPESVFCYSCICNGKSFEQLVCNLIKLFNCDEDSDQSLLYHLPFIVLSSYNQP